MSQYKRGWNISNKNLQKIFKFIDEFEPKNKADERNIKILKYAFEDNMTAMQIARLKDKDIICFSNRAKGKNLSASEISRIIKNFNLIEEKRIDYSKRNAYYRRKEITKKIHKNEINKPKICGCCGKTKKIELHHIIPISLKGNDDYYNLIYLCHECHQKIHKNILEKIGV